MWTPGEHRIGKSSPDRFVLGHSKVCRVCRVESAPHEAGSVPTQQQGRRVRCKGEQQLVQNQVRLPLKEL